MDARLQLVLLLTDKAFSILQHIQEVKEMTKVQVLQEIERERLLKDSLVEEVTLP